MVPQRGWGNGAGHGTSGGTGGERMAASTADLIEEETIGSTLGCEKEDAARLASDDERQSRSGTGVDAKETQSPTQILRRPTEASAGGGDSSTSAATEHHTEGDGVDDQLRGL